jgi:hypothetical protein
MELEEGEETSKALAIQPAAPVGPKKHHAKKAAELANVKSFCHSTRMNKNLDGFKVVGLADPEAGSSPMYVGRFDREVAMAIPLHLSKDNLQAIVTGFLKM